MPDRLRVLFVIGSTRSGGSERQVVNILRFLDRTRFEPLLYLVERTGELLPEVPHDVPIVSFDERHAVPRFYFPGRIHRRQVRDLAQLIRSERVDVLYDRTWQMTLIAGAAARRSPVRRISTAVSDPRLVLEYTTERFRLLKREFLRRAYRRADRVAAVSQGVRDATIRYYGLEPDRVEVVPNLVDLERIDRMAAQDAPGLEPDRFHILTVGRLGPEKGYAYLLRAVEELVHGRRRENLLVHLLGEGPQRAELEAVVRARRLEAFVRFEGHQANPYSWMKRAQLFCLPSLFEGMPNALIEALACGLPAVAADCPHGPAEILGRGRFGRLVPPADAAALADAIEDALTNYPQWQARTGPARTFVEETFSARAAVAKLEQLLLRVTAR